MADTNQTRAAGARRSASGASKPTTKTTTKLPLPRAKKAGGTKGAAPAASKVFAPKPPVTLSAEERRRRIAEAAYYRAERRGFVGGDSARDWLEAEAEVDAQLLGRGPRD